MDVLEKKMRLYIIYITRIESTNGNFCTLEKAAIPIFIVTCTLPIPIPVFGILMPMEKKNPIPVHISTAWSIEKS